MASTKSKQTDGASREAPGRVAAQRDRRADPPVAGRLSRGKQLPDRLRDLLGDYSEQTGAFFG